MNSRYQFRFWFTSYKISAVNAAVDFWVFIILREKHISAGLGGGSSPCRSVVPSACSTRAARSSKIKHLVD